MLNTPQKTRPNTAANSVRPENKDNETIKKIQPGDADVKVADISAFLRAVNGLIGDDELPDGCNLGIVSKTPNGMKRVACSSIESAASLIAEIKEKNCCYYETSLGPETIHGGRLTADEAQAVAHFRLDLDFQSQHRGSGKKHPKDEDEALRALDLLLKQMPPSLIVYTGHGLHIYWCLKEYVDLTDSSEKMSYLRAALALHHYATKLMADAGYDLDNVSDLARIMRVVGSNNCKDASNPILVTYEDSGKRYASPQDVLDALPELNYDIPDYNTNLIQFGDYESEKIRSRVEKKLIAILNYELEELSAPTQQHVTRAWSREALRGDSSQSAHDWRLMCVLCTCGAEWTAEELAAALFVFRNACAAAFEGGNAEYAQTIRNKATRRDYIVRTVSNAIAATSFIVKDDYEGSLQNDCLPAKKVDKEQTVTPLGQDNAKVLNILPTPKDKSGNITPHLVVDGESPATIIYCRDILVSPETPVNHRLFERGGCLVHLATFGAQTYSPCFTSICKADKDLIAHLLAKYGCFEKIDGRTKKKKRIEPPKFIPGQLISAVGLLKFPKLKAVVSCPTISKDGTIWTDKGYDEATGLYLTGDLQVNVKDVPTQEDARIALTKVKALLAGFPFEKNKHRSVALSMLLTAVVRPSISVAPLFLISAPTRGTGKSTLVHVVSILATGRKASAIAATDQKEEFRKRIDAALLAGEPIVNLDNLNWDLESETLAQAVSEPTISLRLLGKSEQQTIENTAIFIANGNNLHVADDLSRRSLIVRLDAKMEQPELRGFKFDPLDEAHRHRAESVECLLTMVRAYICNVIKGSDTKPELLPWAGFDEWSALVRGALIWLGEPDPCLTVEDAAVETPEMEKTRVVFESWFDEFHTKEVTAVELARHVEREPESELSRAITAALSKGPNEQEYDARNLGYWLRSKRGVVAGGLRLENKPDPKKGARWFLTKL